MASEGGGFSFQNALSAQGSNLSGIIGGIQSATNATIQARVAGLNAAESRLQKSLSLQNAAVDRTFLIRQQKTQRGQQAGQFAKGGVALEEGSALKFLVQQARIDRFNVSRFDYQTAVTARNFEIQAQQADFQRKVAKVNRTFAIASTAFSAGSFVAGGFA